MINTENKNTTKIITGYFNGRTGQNTWCSYKRKNIDKKRPNKQGRTLLEFCEREKLLILNGIDTKRKEKQRKRHFDNYWTYEDSKGHSVIDYSLTEINTLDKISNVIIDDDIWECCNTQHRAVITEILLEDNVNR